MNNENVLIRLDEISIKSILRDLFRNCWMIILAAISGVFLVSGYHALIYTPEYTSSATMVVSAKGSGTNSTYANLTTTTEMASVFQDVFGGNVLKKLVREYVDEELGEFTIRANVISETNLLTVKVTASTPKAAYLIINTVIDHHTEVSDYVFDNAVLDVLEAPKVPVAPSNNVSVSNYKKLGMLAGAFLVAACITMLSILRGTVKTEVQARRKLDDTFLALVGHEEKNRTLKSKLKRQNKAILITNPLVSFGYTETFRKLTFRIQYEMQKKQNQILLVSSVGENEGKSTIAANIALALAQTGKKVALVDLDLRRPAIYKIFEQAASAGQKGFWHKTIRIKGNHEIKLVLNNRPVKDPVKFMSHSDIEGLLNRLKEEADFIVLDSAPMEVAADAEMTTAYADAGVLVVRQDWANIQEINHYMDILRKTGISFMGYVLNDFENNLPVGSRQYNYGYGGKYGRYGYGEYHKTKQENLDEQ